jgi:hypothetical protein
MFTDEYCDVNLVTYVKPPPNSTAALRRCGA